MSKGRIVVAGIGPGSEEDITPAVRAALLQADVVVGYKYYFRFVKPFLKDGAQCIDTNMKSEMERAGQAFNLAETGNDVCVISSGDAGIYGMASLVYEMAQRRNKDIEVACLPGISAFQKAASLLGAPIGHDFCVISLSDLLTPWTLIEKRIRAAAVGDFVTAVYNPRSDERYWQLPRLLEIFIEERRSPQTLVGYVRQAGRDGQKVCLTTLSELKAEGIDMFTILLIGNSQSFTWKGRFITPRGYYRQPEAINGQNKGQDIMIQSFRTIESKLHDPNIPLERKWLLLHAIHTTADFEMEKLLYLDEGVVPTLYNKIKKSDLQTIVTDVSMVASGIRKGALKRLGVEVKCYLADPRTAGLAAEKGVTRTQAGIRLAVDEHPEALFVFGNAPTALMELCDLIRKRKAHPAGVIAAPVGFVHVEESKYRIKAFEGIPKIIVKGRKGGSNLAATLVNAVLCFNDAEQLRPGKDV